MEYVKNNNTGLVECNAELQKVIIQSQKSDGMELGKAIIQSK